MSEIELQCDENQSKTETDEIKFKLKVIKTNSY